MKNALWVLGVGCASYLARIVENEVRSYRQRRDELRIMRGEIPRPPRCAKHAHGVGHGETCPRCGTRVEVIRPEKVEAQA